MSQLSVPNPETVFSHEGLSSEGKQTYSLSVLLSLYKQAFPFPSLSNPGNRRNILCCNVTPLFTSPFCPLTNQQVKMQSCTLHVGRVFVVVFLAMQELICTGMLTFIFWLTMPFKECPFLWFLPADIKPEQLRCDCQRCASVLLL